MKFNCAHPSMKTRHFEFTNLEYGVVGTMSYKLGHDVRTLPVQILAVDSTDVDYIKDGTVKPDNAGQLVIVDTDKSFKLLTYSILR